MKPFINVRGDWNVRFHVSEPVVVQLSAYALGYREAAKVLVRRLVTDGYGDYDGYPILYLYRHSLELYMKALVYRGASLLGLLKGAGPNTTRLFERHELSPLISPSRAILSTMKWDLRAAGFESFREFEEFIQLLESIDPKSYAFRYPVDRAGNVSGVKFGTINILAFAEVCDPLLSYLEGAVDAIEEHWQFAAEASHEIQQFLSSEGDA